MDRILGLTNTTLKRELTTVLVAIFIVPAILPILLILSVLSLVVQKFVAALAKIFRPDLFHLLDNFDLPTSIAYPHVLPGNTILSHYICDGQVQLEFLRQQFHQRIINCCDPGGQLKYQKLRLVWTQFCGFLFWKWEKNFDLNNHVRLYDYTDPELAISFLCTEEGLTRVTGPLLSKPYVKGRSPWEMLLIPDYQYVDDKTGQIRIGSVLTLKIHHTLADGFSISKLLKQLFDIDEKVPSANFPHLPPLRKLSHVAIMILKFPYDFAQALLQCRDGPSSWHIVDKKLSKRYVTFSSERIPIATIKAIKNKYGVGYNTAVYAITAGVVSRLMREAGQEVPKSMTSYIPYPMPDHPDGLVNHASGTFFSFSPSVQNPVDRLNQIASQIKDPRTLPTLPISMNWLFKFVLLRLPMPVVRFICSSHFSIVMTSFPGFEKPAKIMEGVQLVDDIPCLGHAIGTLGATADCLTTNGHLRIVMAVDQLIFHGYKIPSNFNELLKHEINELLREQV